MPTTLSSWSAFSPPPLFSTSDMDAELAARDYAIVCLAKSVSSISEQNHQLAETVRILSAEIISLRNIINGRNINEHA